MTENGRDDTTRTGDASKRDQTSDTTASRRHLLQGLAGTGVASVDPPLVGEVDASTARRPNGFVKRDGATLSLDGQRWYFSGANSFQLVDPTSDTETVNKVFQRADDQNLDVIRTWAFCSGQEGRCFQPYPWHHDEDALKRLDYVVKKAGEHDIRLVLALVGNWDHYGGKHQYVEWTDADHPDDFYTNQDCRNMYKHHVETILTRQNTFTGVQYRNDPTIMIWELANEPRAPSDPSGETLESWFRDMSQFVKSLDGNHLVSTGMEGFFGGGEGWMYDGSEGTYYVRHHGIDTIDVATFHMYPQHWVSDPGRRHKWAISWLQNHIRSAHNIGKPVYLGEFTWADSNQAAVYRDWYDVLDKEDADGALLWNFATGKTDESNPYSISPNSDPGIANTLRNYCNRVEQKRNGGGGSGGSGGDDGGTVGSGDPSGGLPLEDGVYQLVNVNSGKVLEVGGPGFYNGANVRQWENHGTDHQHWFVEHVRDDLYRLQSVRTGKVLDVQGESERNGMNVYQWEYHGGPNQLWEIDHTGNAEYRLLAKNSGKALEVADYSTNDGGNVRQWDWHGDSNQRWHIRPMGGSRTHYLNAEYYELSGTTTSADRSGFWGEAYVTDFTDAGDSVTMEFTSAYSGKRSLNIRYAAPNGDKKCHLYVNGSRVNSPTLWWSEPFRQTWIGDYWFDRGTNTITIEKNWGYFDVGCLIVGE